MSVRPKKHLGQHFLWDQNIARKIVEVAKQTPTRKILEIGPGKGVLTQLLHPLFKDHFYAVEIDQESVQYLKEQYPEVTKRLVETDFLEMNMRQYFEEPFSIVGNFPYNISSQIFFKVLENKNQIPFVVGMVQKEVAQRISAHPGSKTYGILSVLLQAFYNIKIEFHVGPNSFQPPPKVKSSVITLRRNDTKSLNCNESLFFRIVKESFNKRRKILKNGLKSFLLNLNIEDDRLGQRPEQLTVNDFVEITNKLEGSTNQKKERE